MEWSWNELIKRGMGVWDENAVERYWVGGEKGLWGGKYGRELI